MGAAKAFWRRLSAGDLLKVAGRREVLSACLQRLYGLRPEAAEKEIDAFCSWADRQPAEHTAG